MARVWMMLVIASGVAAQTLAPPPPPQPMSATTRQLAINYPGVAYLGSPITGEPYSAQEVAEHTQTLADGTHITQRPITTQLYRDSEGRTRSERPMGSSATSDGAIVIQIRDPVAQCQYTLDTTNRIAYRVAGAQQAAAVQGVPRVSTTPVAAATSTMTAAQTAESVRKAASVSSEDLGTQTIEGVLAQGQRQTTVIPVGEQGNDAPMTVVHETWFSPQLRLIVLAKNSDPRSGERTTRLTNIVLGDPDPALFQPPPDYQVIEKTDSFQIRFTLPTAQ